MNEKLIPFSTTISDSIEACKEVGNRYVKMSGDTEAKIPIEDRMLYQRYAEKFLDAASRLEGLRDLANEEGNEPKIVDGKYQDWDSTKDPQFAPEIEAQIKKREAQNDNSLYNPIWFSRDFRSGARFAIQLLQSKLKNLL